MENKRALTLTADHKIWTKKLCERIDRTLMAINFEPDLTQLLLDLNLKKIYSRSSATKFK